MLCFSKEKYLEFQGAARYDSGVSRGWVDACDGQQVIQQGSLYTCCPSEEEGITYVISPNWVKEEK